METVVLVFPVQPIQSPIDPSKITIINSRLSITEVPFLFLLFLPIFLAAVLELFHEQEKDLDPVPEPLEHAVTYLPR